ncbi:Paraquat-inducible protein B [Aquimixticola soesokkakensis]|uniref:Paraquat-inducible protein B n=1 Tax=Aquimixticola soesokkakensis TaxID=1519096 RepID=A0A1Y5RUF1_9RHOB|nr:MlaD family protein [Aquimixticola soesokkakensis]SLN24491.1 Paraquat-inducible protein B [Aquimixticola soesokkakensis]
MNDLPDVPIETTRKSLADRASIVWIVPLGALVIALAIAWQHLSERGPLVEISFINGSGISAGETEVRYRDIAVGMVEDVTLSDDLTKVIAHVRFDKDVADYIDDDAAFWVVRPEVTTRGISGLGTVLSGVYIEGQWNDDPQGTVSMIEGLAQAPLLAPGKQGLVVTLNAEGQNSISGNTPILYRGIEVGITGSPRLGRDGQTVAVDAAIFAPYDGLVTSTTRFWNTSGFSLNISTSGASVDFESLASLLSGGITFDTIASGGAVVAKGSNFDLYDDEETARSSLFTKSEGPSLELTVIFENNVAGLRTDAAVELDGLRIGTVTNLSGLVDPERFGDSRVRLIATLSIQPERLGLGDDSALKPMAYLQQVASEGMRARLANTSLLTSGLKIELVRLPDAAPAKIDMTGDPYPIFPTAPAELTDVAATAEGVFNRVNNLPIEELLTSAIDFMNGATTLVTNASLQQTPNEVYGLIGDIRGLVTSESVQGVPAQVSAVLDDLQSATSHLDETLTAINQAELATRLGQVLGTIELAVTSANQSIDGVPQILERVDTLLANLESVPVDQLAQDLSGLVTATEALIDQPTTRQLPQEINGALSELSAIMAELRTGGTVQNANDALASASDAADAVAKAANDLPRIVARLDGLLVEASGTLGAYGANSTLNREAREALSDLSAAADAITQFAKQLQRQPNSLILGR